MSDSFEQIAKTKNIPDDYDFTKINTNEETLLHYLLKQEERDEELIRVVINKIINKKLNIFDKEDKEKNTVFKLILYNAPSLLELISEYIKINSSLGADFKKR